MPTAPTLREWLRARPFALGLSSGFFGFFAHSGLLTVLEDEGLLPARLAGSSAGALVAGLWASGVDGPRLRDELHALRREDFWDPRPGLGLLRGRLFRERLDALLAVRTFAACRAPLAVSVYDTLARATRVLTAGELSPAIQASCAVPLLFHPVWVDGRPLLDGGIADRPGLDGLPDDGGRVLHHHLASRSPWRKRGARSMDVPARSGLLALAIRGLPRVGPFRLEEGPRAFAAARRAVLEALGRPAGGGALWVDA
jgi:NTE family protein